MTNITFSGDKQTKLFVLALLNKTVDNDGYIIEVESENPVLTRKGESLHIDNFGGVRNGSEIFLEDNYVSILEDLQSQGLI
jgi:hypothetical protein